jgi:hypothetical protein
LLNLCKSSAFVPVTKLAREDNASFAPYTQSRDLLVIVRLGDIEKMERKMLEAFSSHFLNVGYS